MQQVYQFRKHHYNEEGVNLITQESFVEEIADWQRDFSVRNQSAYANIIIANAATIQLLRKSRRSNKAIVKMRKSVIQGLEYIESPTFPDGFALLQDYHPSAISPI